MHFISILYNVITLLQLFVIFRINKEKEGRKHKHYYMEKLNEKLNLGWFKHCLGGEGGVAGRGGGVKVVRIAFSQLSSKFFTIVSK